MPSPLESDRAAVRELADPWRVDVPDARVRGAGRAGEGRRERGPAGGRARRPTLGLPREIDPGQALLEEVWRTAGAVAWLEAKVHELGEDDLVWGMTKRKDGGDDRGTTYEAKPSIWYELWVRERKHLTEVCDKTLRAGVEERTMRLAESFGQQIHGFLDGVFRDLHLSAAQQKLVPTVVPRHLRAIDGGGG
jgi:hypothetical protein